METEMKKKRKAEHKDVVKFSVGDQVIVPNPWPVTMYEPSEDADLIEFMVSKIDRDAGCITLSPIKKKK